MLNEEGMRSSPASGPSIVVDDDGLVKLMYIRDVWALPDTGIPPSRWPAAPAARLEGVAGVEVGQQVRRHWLEAIAWHAGGTDRLHATRLAAETGDSAAIREVIPPRWDPEVGALLDLDRYTEFFLSLPAASYGLVDADEERSQAATVAAVGRGLGAIIVLPILEPHASQVGDSCLLISRGIYADEVRLVRALDGFARGLAEEEG
ncbi:hypothetical protein CMMCAS05_01380 [Clavibacter michiganensis subsp. michiganensis]|uniref:hypothetical protein n=2 Tax=Clavibacter michiganensis TaxID=28447 RepID=UPI000B6AE0EE|nr:hypothetical protein [Clavibacter michiganensis]OUD95605.1 hypothetical protein CMMCAS05_01380 [Clavibacter michiganensis subsp. michiganensis]OUE11864.1 hypothetical protein CMMCAY01_02550 [Clavibacter michiganensis subsp. michiganensis]